MVRTSFKSIPFFAFILFVFIACSTGSSDEPDEPQGPVLSSLNQLLTARFSASDNGIPVNSDGEITNSNVLFFLPAGTPLENLVLQFSISPRATAYVGSTPLSSGVTEIDFSQAVTLTVEAENGAQRNYSLRVIRDFENLDNQVNAMMQQFNIPGAQLAITRNEQLVYQRSYGLADQSDNTPVDNESLFRIASISKPLTAIAVLKLAETNQLDLDDEVFGPGALLGTQYGNGNYANDIRQITVRHLLEHTSGWTNNPYDPMFAFVTESQSFLIGEMLDNRPLVTSPGSTYSYSNFGYCVLGRVIEEVSGQSYEEYLKTAILSPIGISAMEIGGNTEADIFPKEVKYYDQENFSPYIMNVTRMDSHGGWIASATDLARFLVHIDRQGQKSDILTTSSLNEMYFGFQDWLFYGSLPGTSAAISRINDQYGYVMLVNTRTIPIDQVLNQMNSIVRSSISSRQEWPSYDLF